MLSIWARGGLVFCHQERDIATMMTQQISQMKRKLTAARINAGERPEE